uniref:Uncharacterized protein n=1 Tax=Panagrolaimus sp. ES5 TaxID=591445 RepID=A0AC34F1R3_9BILA
MATKDDLFFESNKNFIADSENSVNNETLQAKKDSKSWKKSNKDSSSFLNLQENEEKNEFKKDAKCLNSSTLSLHIAAYENSIESDLADSDSNEKESLKKKDLIKKWKGAKQFAVGSSSIIENPFEFPRQQNNRANRPGLMQFSASQRLLNPNQADANNQVRPPTLNAMSGDGRSRKRNLLAGGPKSGPSRPKATAASKPDSSAVIASTPAIVPDSLDVSSSAATAQGRQTRQSTLSQRTLEPFTFTQTRSTAKAKRVVPDADADDDEIQIIEEPKPKRRNRRKSAEEEVDIKGEFVIPESLVVPAVNQNSERQGTPFTSIQSRKKKSLDLEVIPDSLLEVDEMVEKPQKSQTNKRTPKQAGLDAGIGEAVKAVKKIKLSTPTPSSCDLKNVLLQTSIRSSPPGKLFQKARQGSFYVARPIQRISVSEMSVWNGSK